MGLIRRLTVSVATAVSLAATLVIGGVAAGGGFGEGPGHFTFQDVNASAAFFDPSSSAQVDVLVDRSLFRSRPRAGGTFETGQMTVLNVTVFDASGNESAFGCFVIPDGDFVVSSDLQQATLNTTVQSDFNGILIPVDGAGPQQADFCGGTGFDFPLTVAATWTGTGATAVQEGQGTFRCDSFLAVNHVRLTTANSLTLTMSVSGVGSFSGGPSQFLFGFVQSNHLIFDVAGTGILDQACGGGKGGG
jgi:hypothetical protein